MFGVYETHEVKGVGGNGVFRGSVSSIRSMGKVLFFDVRHGKAKMQVYFQSIKNDKLSFAVKKLNVGDFVNVHGIYF
jgi:lysyl-tRNA synthetase class II